MAGNSNSGRRKSKKATRDCIAKIVPVAIGVVKAAMNAEDAPWSVRLNAASYILDQVTRRT